MECESVSICTLPLTNRSKQIINLFMDVYKTKPNFFVRVPGRVNLIGEHIDYCGYSVCPMALDQDVLLAVSLDDDKMLCLYNSDPTFESYQCPINDIMIEIKEGAPKWYQYYLCGVKGILDRLPNDTNAKGIKIVVNGNVPQSAGLSSSSALVSAAALATAHSYGLSFSKENIANICAECERYIGTQGGGMDQAIAFLANEGCAKHIEFNPIRATDVILPAKATFVVAHSLINMNKAATVDFNCRVIECRLAAQIIAKKFSVDWTKIKRLSDVQQALSVNLTQMISFVKSTLHDHIYTIDEILTELETTFEKLETTSLIQNTKHMKTFKLRQRALHVFNEALRVKTFIEVCSLPYMDNEGNEKRCNNQVLQKLGSLMSESHESLKDLYECSHPQLDRLVELSKNYTWGARLTGAGWGGCIVALLSPENIDKYLEFLKENYYKDFGIVDFSSILFVTTPQRGACIYI